MAAILAMAAIGAWAVLTGQISYVVTHGVSMNPVYHQGDLVIVVKHPTYQVGQIVAYRESATSEKVLHRIVGGNAQAGFVFKGDNNESADPVRPTADRLVGSAALHIPKGGFWLKPLLSPSGLGMIGFLIVGGGTAVPRTRREIPRGRRKKKVMAMSGQGSPLAPVLKAFKSMSPILQSLSLAVAVLGCLAVILGVLGWMKPVVQQGTTASTSAPTVTFSYSATVPRTAAYDRTVVRSPDPVFRKLAHVVDVRVHYQGPAGSMTVTQTVSSDSGWHSDAQLVGPQRFFTENHDAQMTLNLDKLANQAAAAGAATGLQSGLIQVNLSAQITDANGGVFTAPLKLQLEPLRMKLANDATSLVVKDSVSPTLTVALRRIRILGHSVMTATDARAYAAVLSLLTTVGAVAIALAVRRTGAARTRSEIERRYPRLLVHVEPMASPPGKPVVNVDSFPALAKLAERYGQMILTWRRPDADDFVVRDEGITYRYRVPLDEPQLQNVEHRDPGGQVGSHRRRDVPEMS